MKFKTLKSLSLSISLSLLVVGTLAAAPRLRLQEVGVTRFIQDPAGRDMLERGWLNTQGQFEREALEPVLSTVVVPAGARHRVLVTRDMAGSYRRLGPVALANFLVDDWGDYYTIGQREYVEIKVSPAAQTAAGVVPNLSTRGRTGGGLAVIGGFVVMDQPRKVLVRVVGPGLAIFGVSNPAQDPGLTLYREDDVVHSNDNWGDDTTAAVMANAEAQVGAFPLAAGSKDAAYLVTLQPGAYTVQATSAVAGEVLMEVYLLP